jgi:hypothetical protein
MPSVGVRDEQGDDAEARAQWRGQVIYCSLSCAVMTLMPTKDRLICAKTATKHFSKALMYDSGNRQ